MFFAGVAYARRDLYERFTDGRNWDWAAALQWLVLHGIDEHRLWPFLSRTFVAQLLAKTVWAPEGLISPLQLFCLRERPTESQDWPVAGSPAFHDAFKIWMRDRGTDMFHLFWLRSRPELLENMQAVSRDEDGRDFYMPPASGTAHTPAVANTPTSLTYRSFGQDFPCLRLNCLDPSLFQEGAWRGLVRLAPSRTHLEFLEPSVGLQLPSLWLPACVLLLDLEVHEAQRSAVWVSIILDSNVVDRRPASAYAGSGVKIMVAERPESPAPLMQFEFHRHSVPHTSDSAPKVYARLYGLQLWQLDPL